MVRGLATVVRFTNGTVNVVSWAGGPRPGANVVMARQNLTLLVANARPTVLVVNNGAWGLTLHGAPAPGLLVGAGAVAAWATPAALAA
jgi:hypothetical protein